MEDKLSVRRDLLLPSARMELVEDEEVPLLFSEREELEEAGETEYIT